jgi:hypothetical protein
MRLSLRFAVWALVAGLLGVSPAAAQDQPKSDAEFKKAQEQLEKLVQQLHKQEAEKREDGRKARPDASKPLPTPDRPKSGSLPAPGDAATAALKDLAHSKDPKVAGLARELLGLLARSDSKPGGDGRGFQFNFAPGSTKPSKPAEQKARGLELKFETAPGKPGGDQQKGGEKRIVVVAEGGKGSFAASGATSSLKLSADGKTAAVVGSDGTVTIYDVATGRETMRFAGKK